MFLITGGKGYYLGGAIVPLIAAGYSELARRWGAGIGRLRRANRRLVAGAWPRLPHLTA